MTNPTVRSVATAHTSRSHVAGSSSALLTLATPAGVLPGDGMMAVLVRNEGNNADWFSFTSAISAPDGWVLVRQATLTALAGPSGPPARFLLYKRTAVAGDPTTWTWTDSHLADHIDHVSGAIIAVQHFTSFGQEAESGSIVNNGGHPNVVGPITTANAGALVLWLLVSVANSSWSTPSGLTQLLEVSENVGGAPSAVIAAYSSPQVTGPLSTGTKSFLPSVIHSADFSLGIQVEVTGPLPPAPLAITPNTGGTGGGTPATLTGSHFSDATSATLGGNAVTDFHVVDDSTITFTVPAHAAGPVDLVISGVTLAACFTYVPPTVASISPAVGGAAGGEFVTITGTGFSVGMTAKIAGVALTTPAILSSTTITGYTPAHADGSVDVTVADTGATATLAAGFRYSDVFQLDVALAKAGTLGTAKTDTAQLGVLGQWREYGGSTDLWSDTWTPAQINASGFGAGLAAHMKGASLAQLDAMEIEVFYTVEGIAEPQSLLVVMRVDADRLTVTPELYQLPRSGMNVAHDPNVDADSDGATFYTSRYYRPSRNVLKFWRDAEFWLDVDPQTNVPGFQLWAAIDEGAPFQLNDASGTAATLTSAGAKRLYFPPSANASGNYVQLIPTVPDRTGTQQPVAVRLRDMVLHGVWQPLSSELIHATIRLGWKPHTDGTRERRTIQAQRAAITALATTANHAIAYRDPNGATGYLFVESLTERWISFKAGEEAEAVALLTLRTLTYDH